MIPDLSMASPVSMRVQRTWPSHVRQKFAPLASRLWRKSRYELKWEAGFFTVPPGVCLCVLHFLCALLVLLSPQTEYARFENGRFVYRISRSPMCEYMINFIHKLKHLPEKYMMNSVLENFTILLVITSLTWVGDVPLWECFSCCCQDVLVAPAGFKKKSEWGRWGDFTGPWDVFLCLDSHSSHSTGDETQCEDPHYLQGKGRIREGRKPCYWHHMGS